MQTAPQAHGAASTRRLPAHGGRKSMAAARTWRPQATQFSRGRNGTVSSETKIQVHSGEPCFVLPTSESSFSCPVLTALSTNWALPCPSQPREGVRPHPMRKSYQLPDTSTMCPHSQDSHSASAPTASRVSIRRPRHAPIATLERFLAYAWKGFLERLESFLVYARESIDIGKVSCLCS